MYRLNQFDGNPLSRKRKREKGKRTKNGNYESKNCE